MISVEQLTKVYKSKKGAPTTALDGITFDLPDKGMVFVLGKSGSGKSTLLNMLGGLDTITSGDVIADGNRFSTFTDADYDNYRNSFVGFVFQDFCLIESFTVRENIMLALNLEGVDNDGEMYDVAERLEIEDLLDRLPKELSGGQRQRVAIARAIIKKPGLVLADEPTGNLDSKSAQQVLETLQMISKDSLVMVVSHNPDDAEKYGDRIIEIADGKIINDHVKNKDASFEVAFDENEIILPCNTNITEGDIDKINDKIKGSGFKLKQGTKLFSATPTVEGEHRGFSLKASKLSAKNMGRISVNFLKSKWIGFLVSVLMASAIIIMFGLCQLFASFNSEKTMEKALQDNNSDVFVLQKAYRTQDGFDELVTSGTVRVEDEDIAKFYENGYTGNIYRLTNLSFTMIHSGFILESHMLPNNKDNYQQFYARESMGTLICDEDYLAKIYGNDGKVNYLAFNPDQRPYGIILTDFQADSIMFHYPNLYPDYNSILGASVMLNRGYVNAIVETKYMERYGKLKDDFVEAYKSKDLFALAEIRKSEEYMDFLEELNTFLNIAYTFNENILDEIGCKGHRHFVPTKGLEYSIDLGGGVTKTVTGDNNLYFASSEGRDLADNEIVLNSSIYNELFGTNITTDQDFGYVDGQKITCSIYPINYSGEKVAIDTAEFTIVGITSSFSQVSDGFAKHISQFTTYTYGLYFDNPDMAYSIYNTGDEMDYAPTSPYFKAILTINDIVEVFKQLFVLIAVFLCFAGALVLLSFGTSSVKKRNFEVGVIKAIGGNTKNLALIFTMQILLAGLLICVISSIGLYVTAIVANKILASSFVVLFESTALATIEVIHFNPLALVLDLAIVLAITILAAIVPIVSIRKIKPLEILRAKE